MFRVSRLGAAIPIVAIACTDATGELRGGNLEDSGNTLPDAAGQDDISASPTSWSALYRDFFGDSAPSGCGRTDGCHRTPGKAGALTSNFVCADKNGCFDSIRNGKHPVSGLALVESADTATPERAMLFKTIRYLEGDPPTLVKNGGSMPALPRDFAFSAAAKERMTAWIRNGASND